MAQSPKRLPAVFFRAAAGTEPVREWLKSDLFSPADRQRIGAAIKTVEYGWPVGMPTCRPLGGGVWEVRVNLHARIARVLFCVHGGTMVLLHGFIKQSRKTLRADLELARQRMRNLERSR